MNIVYYVISSIIILSLVSCVNNTDSLHDALVKAGMNRIELDKVLNHYKSQEEKHCAAVFLISNMPYHASMEGGGLEIYHHIYNLFSEEGTASFKKIDSIQSSKQRYNIDSVKYKQDIRHLTSEELIEIIDDAFYVRELFPWCKGLSFDIFFKYVLPYRLSLERYKNYNKKFREVYKTELDSLVKINCKDPLEVANVIIRKWNQKPFQWTGSLPGGPGLGPEISFVKAGTCREFAHGIVYILRACGVPCGIDYVPIRGDDNAPHQWPFVLDREGNTFAASTELPEWIPAYEFHISGAKVYRQEFCINNSSEFKAITPGKNTALFYPPLMTDVTSSYKYTYDLKFKLPKILEDSAPIFLCLANHKAWVPVGVASKDNRNLIFKNVSGGVMAILGKYENGSIKPISRAFEISESGRIRFLNPCKKCIDITLFTKFPFGEKNGDVVDRMIGGEFQGADNPDFRNPVIIYTITSSPHRKINIVLLDKPTSAFRYFRYKGADGSYCNIAEAAFFKEYKDSLPLRGKIIGTIGDRTGDLSHDYTKVFDGDLMSSFDYKHPSGGWSGIMLDKPEKISKIMFSPRNRDNFITAGDQYELFYFDKEWKSLGCKTATADSLTFVVPKGALYFLKNHTNGFQERIFEIDNKQRQKFW